MNVEVFNDPSAMTAFNFGLCQMVQIENASPNVVSMKFYDRFFRFECSNPAEAQKQFKVIAAELAKAYKSA